MRLTVHALDGPHSGRRIVVKTEGTDGASLSTLLTSVGKRLYAGLAPTNTPDDEALHLYNSVGGEIDSLTVVEEDEVLFVSAELLPFSMFTVDSAGVVHPTERVNSLTSTRVAFSDGDAEAWDADDDILLDDFLDELRDCLARVSTALQRKIGTAGIDEDECGRLLGACGQLAKAIDDAGLSFQPPLPTNAHTFSPHQRARQEFGIADLSLDSVHSDDEGDESNTTTPHTPTRAQQLSQRSFESSPRTFVTARQLTPRVVPGVPFTPKTLEKARHLVDELWGSYRVQHAARGQTRNLAWRTELTYDPFLEAVLGACYDRYTGVYESVVPVNVDVSVTPDSRLSAISAGPPPYAPLTSLPTSSATLAFGFERKHRPGILGVGLNDHNAVDVVVGGKRRKDKQRLGFSGAHNGFVVYDAKVLTPAFEVWGAPLYYSGRVKSVTFDDKDGTPVSLTVSERSSVVSTDGPSPRVEIAYTPSDGRSTTLTLDADQQLRITGAICDPVYYEYGGAFHAVPTRVFVGRSLPPQAVVLGSQAPLPEYESEGEGESDDSGDEGTEPAATPGNTSRSGRSTVRKRKKKRVTEEEKVAQQASSLVELLPELKERPSWDLLFEHVFDVGAARAGKAPVRAKSTKVKVNYTIVGPVTVTVYCESGSVKLRGRVEHQPARVVQDRLDSAAARAVETGMVKPPAPKSKKKKRRRVRR